MKTEDEAETKRQYMRGLMKFDGVSVFLVHSLPLNSADTGALPQVLDLLMQVCQLDPENCTLLVHLDEPLRCSVLCFLDPTLLVVIEAQEGSRWLDI